MKPQQLMLHLEATVMLLPKANFFIEAPALQRINSWIGL